MIRNGYYYPDEIYEHLTKVGEDGEVIGDAQLGICFGNRTGGKTVGHGIQWIRNYTERGERCCLLCRTEKDKQSGYLEKFWRNKILLVDDYEGIVRDFSKRKIEFTKDQMLVDGDVFCYCEAISMSSKVKDTGAYDHCTTVCMDEACQTGERVLYINGRTAMERIFEIWQTVARGWEHAQECTHLIFIANVSEKDNWIFSDLGINAYWRQGMKFNVRDGKAVEIVMNKTAKERVEHSYMGQIMMRSTVGKQYYESAQSNAFSDNTSFIKKLGLDFHKLRVQVATSSAGRLGVFDIEEGKYHISKIEPDDRSEVITIEGKLHTDKIRYEYMGDWEKLLRSYYLNGLCTFSDQQTKNAFLSFIRM